MISVVVEVLGRSALQFPSGTNPCKQLMLPSMSGTEMCILLLIHSGEANLYRDCNQRSFWECVADSLEAWHMLCVGAGCRSYGLP